MTPQFGTGTVGEGPERIRVTTMVGRRDGPIGTAWATAIANPSAGHPPFVVTARPDLPVVPFTLLVPAVTISGDRHARLHHGAAQAGVAAAVLDLQMDDPDGELCAVTAVSIEPAATDPDLVFAHVRDATRTALQMGAAGGPWSGHLHEVTAPENDEFRRP